MKVSLVVVVSAPAVSEEMGEAVVIVKLSVAVTKIVVIVTLTEQASSLLVAEVRLATDVGLTEEVRLAKVVAVTELLVLYPEVALAVLEGEMAPAMVELE